MGLDDSLDRALQAQVHNRVTDERSKREANLERFITRFLFIIYIMVPVKRPCLDVYGSVQRAACVACHVRPLIHHQR